MNNNHSNLKSGERTPLGIKSLNKNIKNAQLFTENKNVTSPLKSIF